LNAVVDTVEFSLVSPERHLVSVAAKAIQIPGVDGDMTVMSNHAPLISTLRPGVVVVDADQDRKEYIVFGGFVEIGDKGVSVLAEKAVATTEFDRAMYENMLTQAKDALQSSETTQAHSRDVAAKVVADLEILEAYVSG